MNRQNLYVKFTFISETVFKANRKKEKIFLPFAGFEPGVLVHTIDGLPIKPIGYMRIFLNRLKDKKQANWHEFQKQPNYDGQV